MKPFISFGFFAVLFLLVLTACRAQQSGPAAGNTPDAGAAARHSQLQREVTGMKIWSPDFQNGQTIPARFTCDGEGLSPTLNWSGVPAEAKSLALVVDDPDAPRGTWVHWVVVNLSPITSGLPEGGRPLPTGAVEVPNDFGRPAYGGPCPPNGVHRYFFKLVALDVPELTGLTRKTFSGEILKHAVSQAETIGTYARKR